MATIEMKNTFDALAFRAIVQGLLSMQEGDFPQKPNANFADMAGISPDEFFPHCPFCKRAGLFAGGNGGIAHLSDCPITLARRLQSYTKEEQPT